MFPPWPLRVVRAAVCLVPLLSAGCFVPIGYAYPTVSVTPAVDVGKQAEDVQIFRVEIADVRRPFSPGWGPDRYVFHPVEPTANGRGSSQVGMALDYGWVWNPLPLLRLAVGQQMSHTVLVRVYRPGFRTVELAPGQSDGTVAWEVAPDLVAQEQAIDALVSTRDTDSQAIDGHPVSFLIGDERRAAMAFLDPAFFRSLAPGSTAPGHREALLFAAGEYEHLSRAAEGEQRTRLRNKARSLRDRANR
jgi:hypothetical protein